MVQILTINHTQICCLKVKVISIKINQFSEVCWFENILSNSFNKKFTHLKGIGLLNLSCTPHASSEPQRVKVLQTKIRNGIMPPGIVIDDGVGVLFINGEIKKVFTARKNHSAYFIDQTNIKNLEQ